MVIADDNPLVRMGLRSLLESSGEVEVVAEAANGEEAVASVDEYAPDVVLLDVRMPELDGLGAVGRISGRTRVLMLTSSEEPATVQAALAGGACGYLVHGAHTPEEIVAAVSVAASGSMVLGPAAVAVAATALAGGGAGAPDPVDTGRSPLANRFGLTEREAEIMTMIADGKPNREIARTCYLAEKTVKNHINRIFTKLGVSSRAEAVSRWLKVGA